MNVKLFRFLIAGSVSTVLNYSVFSCLFLLLEVNHLVASALGFVSGVLLGYVINKNWTYEHSGTHGKLIYKYIAVYLMSLIIGLLLLEGLVQNAINPLIANVIVILVTTVINYLTTKYWVFSDDV